VPKEAADTLSNRLPGAVGGKSRARALIIIDKLLKNKLLQKRLFP
jgi:hypothetical protein